MLRHIGILAMIYLGVVAQSSLVPTEILGMGRPFLPAILLVVIALACNATASIVWSGLLGLVLDGLSTERLGVQLALAALLGLGLQVMQSLWRSRSLVPLVAMSMILCVAWRTLSPMTHAVLSGRIVDPHLVLTDAVQDAGGHPDDQRQVPARPRLERQGRSELRSLPPDQRRHAPVAPQQERTDSH